MRSILIVCLGNICRSPYAEQRLADELAARGVSATVTSAGFILPGRPSPPAARRVAARRGVDLEEHFSRVFTPEELEAADLVLVMSPGQSRRLRTESGVRPACGVVLGDLDPLEVDRRTIADPFDRPDDVFEEVYARIDRCCRALANSLAAAAGRTG